MNATIKETILQMRLIYLFVMEILFSAIKSDRTSSPILICYFNCDTSGDICRAKKITLTEQWFACNGEKLKCQKKCRSGCWLRCKPDWMGCFKEKILKNVSNCIKRKKARCAERCAIRSVQRENTLFRLIIYHNLLILSKSLRYPDWPVDFAWSSEGSLDGYNCLDVTEREETMLNFWDRNFLCVRNGTNLINPEFQWSDQGPIIGLKCCHIYEPSDPHGWFDNYLCYPPDVPYNFTFSDVGCDVNKYCIHMEAPFDQHTWFDNYLCHEVMGDVAEGNLTNLNQYNQQNCIYHFNRGKSLIGNAIMIVAILNIMVLVG